MKTDGSAVEGLSATAAMGWLCSLLAYLQSPDWGVAIATQELWTAGDVGVEIVACAQR
jgi:hypothetical protein